MPKARGAKLIAHALPLMRVAYLKKGALVPWMVLGISFCQKLLSHDPTHQAALLSVKMVYG